LILPNATDHILRKPVLIAIDEFQCLYSPTLYRDQQFSHIKVYHLSMPRLLLEYAGGVKRLANGMVMGALAPTNTQYPVPRELTDSLKLPTKIPSSPYDKKDKYLMEYAKGLKNMKLPDGFTLKEASSVFDTWMKDRALAVG
jgi:small subunit ribosomal protein S29